MNTGFNLLKINRDKEHFISYMTLTFENEMQFLQNKLFNKKGKKAKKMCMFNAIKWLCENHSKIN